MLPSHETTVRVRYAETDQMGVVYHSNFLVWFEVGRVELLRSLGFSYKDMEQQDDSHIPVVEVNCRYEKPARYDQMMRIRTTLADARKRTLRFTYEVFLAATGQRLATGETRHVVCDSQGRPKSLPEKYRKLFPADNPPSPTREAPARP
jgi:acyl-CoA thioester hydrolase